MEQDYRQSYVKQQITLYEIMINSALLNLSCVVAP